MDFSTFEVISVRKSSVVDRNGNLNPEVMVMEEPNLSDDPDTKVARTSVQTMFQSMLGTIHHKDLLHIAGIFQGHDIDNSPLK